MKDSQIQQIEKDNGELNEKMDEINNQLDELTEQNQKLEEEIVKLQEKNQFLSEDVKNFITEKMQMQENSDKIQEELNSQINNKIQLQQDYEKLLIKAKNLEQDNQNLTKIMNEKSEDATQQEYIEQLKQSISAFQEEIAKLTSRIEKSKNKKKSQKEQITQQESQIKLQQSQYKQLETDLLQVRMKLSNEIQINELKDKQMDDMKKSLKLEKDELSRYKQQCLLNQSQENNEIDSLKLKIEETLKNNKRLQTEKEKVIKDRIELQRQVVESQSCIEELKGKMLKAQEKEYQGFEEFQQENEKLNQMIIQIKSEKQKMQEDLKVEIKNYQNAQGQITHLQSEKFTIEKEVCLLKEQIANWQRICKEKEEEKVEFGKKQEELIASLKMIENNFKQTNQCQKERLQKSENRADELNHLIQEYENEIIEVKEELEKEKKQKIQLENEIDKLKENLLRQEEQIKQQIIDQNELNRAIIQEKNATSSEQEGQQQQIQILSNQESQQQYYQDKNSLLTQIINSIENFLSNIDSDNNQNIYAFLKNVSSILETDNQQAMFDQLQQVKPAHKKSSSIPLQSSKLNEKIIHLFQQVIACILDENIGKISQNIKTIEEILDENEINQISFDLLDYFKQLKHELKSYFLKRLEIQEENEQLMKQKKDDENKNNNNLNNFVNVENVSNLSIVSDFSELFGESNLQAKFYLNFFFLIFYYKSNTNQLMIKLFKNKLGNKNQKKLKFFLLLIFPKQQFKKIQLDELNKLQKEKRDLEIANEQLKEFNEQLMAEAKDQEKNELRFQYQKNVLQQEISALQEKIQAKAQENMSAHEREHIKTNLLKFLGCAYNKQSQEGDEYLKRVFSMVNVNEADQEEFKKNAGIKSDKKKGFTSLLFKR